MQSILLLNDFIACRLKDLEAFVKSIFDFLADEILLSFAWFLVRLAVHAHGFAGGVGVHEFACDDT